MPLDSRSVDMTLPDSALQPDSILDRTLDFLLSKESVRGRRVTDVYLNNYFTVIRLDDDSVGACMSSFHLSAAMLAESERRVRALLPNDPLLLRYVGESMERAGIPASLKAALANAFSAPVLRAGGDEFFTVLKGRPNHYFSDIDYAVVIGWGGLFEFLLQRTTALRIHVSELRYATKKEEIEAKLNIYRARYPYLELTISDGSDIREHLSAADFIAITGSTLGNSTLDELLDLSSNCRRVILQGQSTGIHPCYLFKAGVHLVATSIKPVAVAEAAAADPTGKTLRPFFEGGLPRIYLEPTASRSNEASE
jgi:hypothetical protein